VRRLMDEFEITFPTRQGNNGDGEEVETVNEPMLEYGLAKHAHGGQSESGDLHMVCLQSERRPDRGD